MKTFTPAPVWYNGMGNVGRLGVVLFRRTRDRSTAEVFHRDYTHREAQQVLDWLNGRDQPITDMVPFSADPWVLGHYPPIHPPRRWPID